MNITEEKREEILAENNTAQSDLLLLLDTLDNTKIDELRFEDPMRGDLDLSLLKDREFKHIHTIEFNRAGEITSIKNIPEGVKTLRCPDQMIVEMTDLPESMEEIVLDGNYLTNFDAKGLPKLRTLHLSNNELEMIENIPNTLEELLCDNNYLKQLDLANATSLHTLHCSNNQLLIVANPPESLIDFQMQNNPLTEMTSTEKTSKSGEIKFNYLESMYDYFSLKRKYEEKEKQMKRAAYKKNSRSKNAKNKPKHAPCISCKRPVGSLFLRKNGRYVALCGDKVHPCNLNIQLYSGNFFNNETLLTIYREDLDTTKEGIIKQKMDTLFNYIGEHESVEKFKEELNKYTEDSKMYKDLLERHKDLYENEERNLYLSKKTEEIYETINEIKTHIKEYDITGNRKALLTGMRIYKRDLMPAVGARRIKKYGIMEMDVFPDNDGSRLVQYELPLQKMDFTFGEPSRVIKYQI